MTHEAFVALMESRIDKIRHVLDRKATEYATSSDRLHNFRHAASMMRCSPAKACWSFMVKHLVSIADLIEQESVNPATVDEKIGDAVNYLILLEAILLESKK